MYSPDLSTSVYRFMMIIVSRYERIVHIYYAKRANIFYWELNFLHDETCIQDLPKDIIKVLTKCVCYEQGKPK